MVHTDPPTIAEDRRSLDPASTEADMVGQQERRAHPRYQIDWPISLRQRQQGQLFNGRGHNLSKGGALVALPMSIPLRPGQEFEVTIQPHPNLDPPEGLPHAPGEVRNARVVRVQRAPRFLEGIQMVGLQFEQPG
jgi:hypothetical protein